MAEFPALPLWTDAHLADTSHLSDAEQGRYLLMLMAMWRAPGCRLPNDDIWLARKFRRSVEDVLNELRPLIDEFCQCDGNWITQKRLNREYQRVSGACANQSKRGQMRWDRDRIRDNAAIRASRMAAARKRGTHTADEWIELKRIIGKCCHCGTTEWPLEKDHILPVYQGGSDAIENIQPSCARCNAKKGAESHDKRAERCAGWESVFENSVGRKLLRTNNGDVCLDAAVSKRMPPEPEPEPEPVSKKEKDSLTGVQKESAAASPSLPSKPAAVRGSRLPEGWTLSADDRDYARSRGLSFEATEAMALDFEQYWRAKAGKDAVKCDWRATWQRWVRNSENYKRSSGASNLKEERLYEERKAREWIIEQAFKSGVVPMAVESDGNNTDPIQRDDGDIKGEVVPIRGGPFRHRAFS